VIQNRSKSSLRDKSSLENKGEIASLEPSGATLRRVDSLVAPRTRRLPWRWPGERKLTVGHMCRDVCERRTEVSKSKLI
jgi:hypothetical protein